ncbi:hypothetical protein H0H87_000656, partial [Tephrocybe sp. NHM501043]
LRRLRQIPHQNPRDLPRLLGAAPEAACLPHGRLGVTYESAQTRKFSRGRTEVIRSASTEAKAFVEGMHGTPAVQGARDLFRKAAERHMRYAGWAADARGMDRNLFGLKKLVDTQRGEEVPGFYQDEVYGKSSHWELSTNQLSSPFLMGEGMAWSSQMAGNNYIRWTITSLKRRTEVLKHYLAEAATEIWNMMEAARKADADTSRYRR